MNNNSQLLQNFGHKLGLKSSSVLRKAEELQRLLAARGVRGLSNSVEAAICLQLAASETGETCDKSVCAKLAGLTAAKYRSQVHAVSQLLGLSQRLSIHDLAVAHSALPGEQLAVDALRHYASQAFGNLEVDQPLYQTAALVAACAHLNCKLDKKKLIDASGATKPVFDKLVLKLKEAAEQVGEKRIRSSFDDVTSSNNETTVWTRLQYDIKALQEDIHEGNVSTEQSVEQCPLSPVLASCSIPNATCRQEDQCYEPSQNSTSGKGQILSQNQLQLQAEPIMTPQGPAYKDDEAILNFPISLMYDHYLREKEDVLQHGAPAVTSSQALVQGAERARLGINSFKGTMGVLDELEPANVNGGQNILTRFASKLTNNGSYVVIQNDTDVKVGNDLIKASSNGDAAVENVAMIWQRRYPAPMDLKHIISWTQSGCVIDDMKPSLPKVYTFTNGSLNSTWVGNRLVASSNVHYYISEHLPSSLMLNTDRWDTSSLYGVGFILLSDLLTRERLKQTALPAVGVVALEYLNTNPLQDLGIHTVLCKMLSDLSERRFIFVSHKLTDRDCNVLAFIAAGGPSLQAPDSNVTLGNNISWPAIPMSIYGFNERIIHSPVVPRSQEVFDTLTKISHFRNEGDMMVRGFLRAMCLWNGMQVCYTPQSGGSPKTVWMTSIGEITGSIWPRPGDYNWMWRALAITPPRPNAAALEGEHATLSRLQIDLLDRVGAAVSSLMSVAVGTFWNAINITGKELTRWAASSNAGVRSHSCTLIEALIKTTSSFVPVVLHVACSIIERFGNWSVNPLAFQSTGWSNLGNNFYSADPEIPSYWAHVFPHFVPYLISPLALGWAVDNWLDVWGVAAPPVLYNIKTDCTRDGVWKANLGSEGYNAVALSDKPYVYVSYGLLVTNALHQRFEVRAQIPIVFVPLLKIGDDVTENKPHIYANNMVYNENLQIIMPGTLLSYNWDYHCVVAPSICPNVLSLHHWQLFRDERHDTVSSPHVGIYKPISLL